MKKNIYSPYLSVYKLQSGSLFSILERITGVFLGIITISIFTLLEFEETCWIYYVFYEWIFVIFHSNYSVVDWIIIFILLNFNYHFFCLHLVLKRIKDEPIPVAHLDNVLLNSVSGGVICACTVLEYYFF